MRDVVGLYLSPPSRALVLCVDEKSQIQALDRSQTVLPMRPGQPERRSHDYMRYGTTSSLAALDIATGSVIGKCYPRHRAEEFRHFLDDIEANVPSELDVHLVWDNYATHKTRMIKTGPCHPGTVHIRLLAAPSALSTSANRRERPRQIIGSFTDATGTTRYMLPWHIYAIRLS